MTKHRNTSVGGGPFRNAAALLGGFLLFAANNAYAQEATDTEVASAWESQHVGRGSSRAINILREVAVDGDNADRTSANPGQVDFLRASLALVVVLAIIIGVAYLLRRLKLRLNPTAPVALQVLARSAIGPKQSLCLVKCGPRLLVVGVSPNHMAALDAIDDPDQIARITRQLQSAAPDSISNSFAGFFGRESQQFGDLEDGPTEVEPLEDGAAEPIRATHNEVEGLLQKVKGLKRLGLAPRLKPR